MDENLHSDAVDISCLLSAVQDAQNWMDRFTRANYPDAFREYQLRYGPVWHGAIQHAESPDALVQTILDALEQGWKSEPFWRRSERRFMEKQTIVVYLAPVLLDIGEETFASCLRDAWARRWPRDPWKIAPFRKIRNSFRTTIMGFAIDSRRSDDDDDDDDDR